MADELADCDTIRCIRHWCTCGGVVNHDTQTCPVCETTYTDDPKKVERNPVTYWDNDDTDLKVRRLGPVLDTMEF